MTPQAQCAIHADVAATSVCSRCGAFTCAACNPSGQGICPACEQLTGASRSVQPTPWERRAELGLVQGLWQTWRKTMLEPGSFVRSLDPNGPTQDAVLYGWLVSTVGALISAPFLLLNFAQMESQLGEMVKALGNAEAFKPFQPLFDHPIVFAAGFTIISIVSFPLTIFIAAALNHLGVRVVGSHQQPFGTTVRAISYSLAPNALSGIPVIGGFVGFYTTVLEIWALKEMHGLSTGRAVVAVLWPLVFFCCCGIGGAAMFGASLASMLSK